MTTPRVRIILPLYLLDTKMLFSHSFYAYVRVISVLVSRICCLSGSFKKYVYNDITSNDLYFHPEWRWPHLRPCHEIFLNFFRCWKNKGPLYTYEVKGCSHVLGFSKCQNDCNLAMVKNWPKLTLHWWQRFVDVTACPLTNTQQFSHTHSPWALWGP